MFKNYNTFLDEFRDASYTYSIKKFIFWENLKLDIFPYQIRDALWNSSR